MRQEVLDGREHVHDDAMAIDQLDGMHEVNTHATLGYT
jgi:hypothetical protein